VYWNTQQQRHQERPTINCDNDEKKLNIDDAVIVFYRQQHGDTATTVAVRRMEKKEEGEEGVADPSIGGSSYHATASSRSLALAVRSRAFS